MLCCCAVFAARAHVATPPVGCAGRLGSNRSRAAIDAGASAPRRLVLPARCTAGACCVLKPLVLVGLVAHTFFSLSLSLSYTRTYTHSLIRPLSNTKKHTHTHTNTHTNTHTHRQAAIGEFCVVAGVPRELSVRCHALPGGAEIAARMCVRRTCRGLGTLTRVCHTLSRRSTGIPGGLVPS